MQYDYSKLKGRIKEKCGNQNQFQEKMGLSHTSINKKLNNKVQFTQEDIEKAIEILELDKKDIPLYFFATKV